MVTEQVKLAPVEYVPDWSADAYRWYEEILDSIDYARQVISPWCPIPEWLQRTLHCKVGAPEAPSMNWARVTDPINWPALLRAHPGDLVVAGTVGGQDPGWAQVVAAYEYLQQQGWSPSLDVDLEVAPDASSLELRHAGIGICGMPSSEIYATVRSLLSLDCDMDWPTSHLETHALSAEPVMPPTFRWDRPNTDWVWVSL